MTAALRSLFDGNSHSTASVQSRSASVQSRSSSVSRKDSEAHNKQFQDELGEFIRSNKSFNGHDSDRRISSTQHTDELDGAINSSGLLIGTQDALISGSEIAASASVTGNTADVMSVEPPNNSFKQADSISNIHPRDHQALGSAGSGYSASPALGDFNYSGIGIGIGIASDVNSLSSATHQHSSQPESVDGVSTAAKPTSSTAEMDNEQRIRAKNLLIQQLLPYSVIVSEATWSRNTISQPDNPNHSTADGALSFVDRKDLALQSEAKAESSGMLEDSDLFSTIAGYTAAGIISGISGKSDTRPTDIAEKSDTSEIAELGHTTSNNSSTNIDPATGKNLTSDLQNELLIGSQQHEVKSDNIESNQTGVELSNFTEGDQTSLPGSDQTSLHGSDASSPHGSDHVSDQPSHLRYPIIGSDAITKGNEVPHQPDSLKQPAGISNTTLAKSTVEDAETDAPDIKTVLESQQKTQLHSGPRNRGENSTSPNNEVARLKQSDLNQALNDTLLMEAIQNQSSSFNSSGNSASTMTSSLGSLASETAIRVDKVVEMRDAAAGKTLSQVTLQIDDANGKPDQIKISARGTALETTIAVSEVNRAEQMLYGTNDLKRSLSQNGFDSNVVRIVSDKETQREDLSRNKQRNKQQSHEQ